MESMEKSLKSHLYLCDNIDFMKSCSDNEFDWGIVDPEYLDKNQPNQFMRAKGGMIDWRGAPKADYFSELFRITKNQIIWGGNYFTDITDSEGVPFLKSNGNWMIWDKRIAHGMNYSMYEMAWISTKKVGKIFKLSPVGKTKDWHSTSKPRELYNFCIKTYLSPGESIFDSNGGSGTLREAAYSLCHPFTGCEINEKYFDASCDDFDKYVGFLMERGDIKNFKIDGL
jgi:site-specific DNA-methyltransferase (adenine-specific)